LIAGLAAVLFIRVELCIAALFQLVGVTPAGDNSTDFYSRELLPSAEAHRGDWLMDHLHLADYRANRDNSYHFLAWDVLALKARKARSRSDD